MNFFRIVFELFALYLLYKLVFDLIIPVARTTKQVKKQFSEMNEQMQDNLKRQQQQTFTASQSSKQSQPASRNDDYIDFEEVK